MWSVVILGPNIFGLWWSAVVCDIQADQNFRLLHLRLRWRNKVTRNCVWTGNNQKLASVACFMLNYISDLFSYENTIQKNLLVQNSPHKQNYLFYVYRNKHSVSDARMTKQKHVTWSPWLGLLRSTRRCANSMPTLRTNFVIRPILALSLIHIWRCRRRG